MKTRASPVRETELDESILYELRSSIVPWLFLFVFLVGLGMTLFISLRTPTLQPHAVEVVAPRYLSLLLMSAALVAWAVHSHHYQLSVVILVIGCAVAIVIAQVTFPTSIAAVALVFLVSVVSLFLNRRSGLLAAIGATLILLILADYQPFSSNVDLVPLTLLLIWGTLLLAWTATTPLYTFAHWSWYYYTQARDHAEAARDRQAELALALKDLAEANHQLVFLNHIVHAARMEAEEAGRAKIAFVANVSHELRTPLNMIIGFSETLLEAPRLYKTTLPPALMADIAAIYRNGCHLQSLIDDVLDISQIDMQRMALTKERTDVRALIAEALEAVHFFYESKGLSLSADLPQQLPEIFCDRTRIREVLLNLLSNAGRFTEQGGVVVRSWQEGQRLVFSVKDSGPGISPVQLQRIFEPFQQLDDTIRQRFGGSGLGLVISRAFVELHGGRMWVESEVGHGSTFFFDLPLPYQPPAGVTASELAGRHVELRARPPRAPSVRIRPRFAVVSQTPVLERLLRRYLSEFEIVAQTTLQEAIARYEEQPFQAIVANAETPGQIAGFLAQSHLLPAHVPLLLTGFPAVSNELQALGVADYLVKPVTRHKLMSALAALPQPVHTILVADDDRDMQQLFDRMLALDSPRIYRLLQAANGREALYLLRTRRPDVLLLDLAMPDMDGIALLKEKNADPTICAIPVLVISARDRTEAPLTASALVATRREGIPVPEVLKSLAELSEILGLLPSTAGPEPTGTQYE